jgi:CobQ-like glutamine amidotransferase family enzyme
MGKTAQKGHFIEMRSLLILTVPCYPRIPFLADWLIQTALVQKYQTIVSLKPLDDTLAMQAREAMFKRLALTHLK